MGKLKDISGHRFGKLLVIERAERPQNSKYTGAYWLCQCDCGNQKVIDSNGLCHNGIVRCGCFKGKDLTGQKFGKLSVIKLIGRRKTQIFWLCRCECGNEKEVSLQNLQNGNTKSCGCSRGELFRASHFRDISGQTFERLTAVKYLRYDKGFIWLFNCECGNEKEINSRNVLRKTKAITSCGCFRSEVSSKLRFKDISGKRFGFVIASRPLEVNGHGQRVWECLCDCGKAFTATAANLKRGKGRNKQNPFHCGCKTASLRSGENSPMWKGGRTISSGGYVKVLKPDNPNSDKSGYVLEHRYVMEQNIGRYLLPHENVHHKNGIRDDNRIGNLELWVKPQTPGQRAKDLVEFAREILQTYGQLF